MGIFDFLKKKQSNKNGFTLNQDSSYLKDKQTSSEDKQTLDKYLQKPDIGKFKLSLIKQFSDIKNTTPVINNELKKQIIERIIESIPELLPSALLNNEDKIWVYYRNIPNDLMDHTLKEASFAAIADELYLVLKELNLDPRPISNRRMIAIELKNLKKFCNYESLVSLK